MLYVGLIGDFDPNVKAHIAIPQALALAAADLHLDVEARWLATPLLEDTNGREMAECQALWCTPGSPYASMDGALRAIQFAREHGVPFLGTCAGFQHAVIEYARNVLGLTEADHAESNPATDFPLIAPLSCSLNDVTNTYKLIPGSRIAAIYGANEVTEQHGICNFGISPRYQSLLEQGGLHISGVDDDGEARVIELPSHPFFIATLYQPERSAFKQKVHPLITAYLQAIS